MKKNILFLLASLMIFSLFSCAEENKYPPVESTEEESRVVMTLSIEDKSYDIKYELYRALFLNNKSRVDGGDNAVWTSADSEKYIDEINALIIDRLSEIFGVIHLAGETGFDIYSSDVDKKIEDYVVGAVEGDDTQIGHGSYDAYLASLKKNNLNYSTATFMLRYAMAEEAVEKYYLGEYDEIEGQKDGKFEYTREDVEAYYYGDDCIRVLQSYFQAGVMTPVQMQSYRSSLVEIKDELSIAAYIIGSTAITESDLIIDGKISGIMIGKDELSGSAYTDYINEIFALKNGEFSEIISVENSSADGYYIVYKLDKNAEHFESCYASVRNSYLDNISGKVIKNMSAALRGSATFTEGYHSVIHSSISMK